MLDALGSNISVSTRTGEVLRILPRENEDINEEWLADKSRFACDGLKRQRLIAPMLRMPNGELQPVEWESALIATAKNLQNAGGKVAAIAGSLADVESMVALKDLLESLGSKSVSTESKLPKETMGKRSTYIMNTPIAGTFSVFLLRFHCFFIAHSSHSNKLNSDVEEADFVLLVGTNPRYEAPLLNTRIRKGYVHNETDVALIGSRVDLSYKYDYIGDDAGVINEIVSGRHPIAKRLSSAKKPVIIVGSDQLARPDGAAIVSSLHSYANTLGSDVRSQHNKSISDLISLTRPISGMESFQRFATECFTSGRHGYWISTGCR